MPISLTPAAAERVRSFMANRGKGIGLRLGVKQTGCSGFAYVVSYADEVGARAAVHGVGEACGARDEAALPASLEEIDNRLHLGTHAPLPEMSLRLQSLYLLQRHGPQRLLFRLAIVDIHLGHVGEDDEQFGADLRC